MAGSWSYDPAQLATNTMFQVRYLIGDTNSKDEQVFDQEIAFALSQRPNIYGAAADICRALATKFAREADTVQADARVAYSAKARNFEGRAREYDRMASARGGGRLYAGGISEADKMANDQNSDLVKPQFNIGMTDNYLPQGPTGNEIPGANPSPDRVS